MRPAIPSLVKLRASAQEERTLARLAALPRPGENRPHQLRHQVAV
jgi:hypothetical protein